MSNSKPALRFIDQLASDQRWKLSSNGVCIAMTNGVPSCCFIFDAWGEREIKEFEQLIAGAGSKFDLKLIGSAGFIATLRRWIIQRGNYTLIKTVVRDVPYDMLYAAAEKQFKISVQEAPKPGNAPALTVVPPVSGRPKIKVLIVDDSQTIRKVLTSIFEQDPGIEVVGALEKPSLVEPFLQKVRPDVMTLDIHMPEMDGVTLLKRLAPKYSIPTIMISSITKEDGPYVFEALENGALDYIQKPSFKEIPSLAPHILERVRQAAQSKVNPIATKTDLRQVSDSWNKECFVLVGASTGGTEALANLLKQFPNQIPPVLVVQHIPPVFSKSFADRLNSMFPFRVVEAAHGELIEPNTVFIAPGGRHMGVSKQGPQYRIAICDDPPVNRHRPSVDFLFNSALKAGMSPMVGCILTGMGSDGARGLLEMRRQGAKTLAQDQQTCIVYGMPKVAFELGAVEVVSPIDKMGQALSKCIQDLAQKTRK